MLPAAAERGQALAVNAGDDQRMMGPHESANGFRMLVQKRISCRDQHQRIQPHVADLGLTVLRRFFEDERARLTTELGLADDAETWQELHAVPRRQVRRNEAGKPIGRVHSQTVRMMASRGMSIACELNGAAEGLFKAIREEGLTIHGTRESAPSRCWPLPPCRAHVAVETEASLG